MESLPKSVNEFYNNISNQYREQITRCVPRYSEMQWAILRYIPSQLVPNGIVELGCGVGNLTDLLVEAYPEAEIHPVDISEKMIEECSQRYKNNPRVRPHCMDFRDLDFAENSVDLVVSSIAIHHIVDREKEQLFQKIHSILKPSGIISYSDQFSAPNQEFYSKNMESWQQESKKNNVSEDEWQMWMDHQESHDYHTTLANQMNWLAKAGFKDIDCVWRYLLWTVVVGIK